MPFKGTTKKWSILQTTGSLSIPLAITGHWRKLLLRVWRRTEETRSFSRNTARCKALCGVTQSVCPLIQKSFKLTYWKLMSNHEDNAVQILSCVIDDRVSPGESKQCKMNFDRFKNLPEILTLEKIFDVSSQTHTIFSWRSALLNNAEKRPVWLICSHSYHNTQEVVNVNRQ